MIADKNNPEFMKEYLKHVITFEKQVYIWENSIKSSQQEIITIEQEQNQLSNEKINVKESLNTVDEKVKKSIVFKENEIKRYKKRKKIPKNNNLYFYYSLDRIHIECYSI